MARHLVANENQRVYDSSDSSDVIQIEARKTKLGAIPLILNPPFRAVAEYRRRKYRCSKMDNNRKGREFAVTMQSRVVREGRGSERGRGRGLTATSKYATVDFLRSIHASRANACRVRICMRTHTRSYATRTGKPAGG